MAAGFFDRLTLTERRFSSDRRQVSRRASFRSRVRVGRPRPGRGLIRVDPELNDLVRDFMEQAAPAVANAFNRHLVPFAERTFQAWPVKSGLSKSLLSLSFRPDAKNQAFAGEITNAAPYAGFIRPGKGFSSRRRLVAQLFADGDLIGELIAADITKNVGR